MLIRHSHNTALRGAAAGAVKVCRGGRRACARGPHRAHGTDWRSAGQGQPRNRLVGRELAHTLPSPHPHPHPHPPPFASFSICVGIVVGVLGEENASGEFEVVSYTSVDEMPQVCSQRTLPASMPSSTIPDSPPAIRLCRSLSSARTTSMWP